MRWKLLIEYDGTPFVGWQRQDKGVSVQGALEDAVFGFTGQRLTITGAGRTDAGVHARGQVAHFDLDFPAGPGRLRDALNALVRPHPVSVLTVEAVEQTFHARFSATSRSYFYRILNRKSPPALDRGQVWHVANPLDAEAMNHAAAFLIGKHDFTTFRAAHCQALSPVKTLDRLEAMPAGEEIIIVAEARSFLHNQVRSMVGSLKLVGEGKWTPGDMRNALALADRSKCGPVAPPQGLALVHVGYGPGPGESSKIDQLDESGIDGPAEE